MDITTTDWLLLILILAYGANVGLLIIQNRQITRLQNINAPQQGNDNEDSNEEPKKHLRHST